MTKYDKVTADYVEGRISYEEYKWRMDLLDIKQNTLAAAIFGMCVLGIVVAIATMSKGVLGL